jgi:hypothetical protein
MTTPLTDEDRSLRSSFNTIFPGEKKSPLSRALAHGDTENAEVIIEEIRERLFTKRYGPAGPWDDMTLIPRRTLKSLFPSMVPDEVWLQEGFSLAELWQIKVLENRPFNDDEFLSLDPKIQKLVYRTAHAYNRLECVIRLNRLVSWPPASPPHSLSVISEQMDLETMQVTVTVYLQNLRKESRLLTYDEFSPTQLNPGKGDKKLVRNPQGQIWRKKDGIGRILGRDYMERTIQSLSLKHMKVPQKIVVLKKEVSDLSFSTPIVHRPPFAEFNIEGLEVWAQEITPVQRLLSRQELEEFFTLCKATNYLDFWPANIVIADDGVYFIDTEYSAFKGMIQEWNKVYRFEHLVKQEDLAWFKKTVEDNITYESDRFSKHRSGLIEPRDTEEFYTELKLFKKQVKEGTPLNPDSLKRAKRLKEVVKRGMLVVFHRPKMFTLSISSIVP